MARERRGAGSSVVSIETLYYKTIYYSKDVLEADEKSSIKENCPFIDVCFDDLPIYVYIYIPRCSVALEYLPGWWCNNHLEKYGFANGVGMTSMVNLNY